MRTYSYILMMWVSHSYDHAFIGSPLLSKNPDHFLENWTIQLNWLHGPTFFCTIRNSLLQLMRKNNKQILGRTRYKQLIIDSRTTNTDNISLSRKRFSLSHLAKAIWNSKEKYWINNSLWQELNLLLQTVQPPHISWSIPISYLVKRTPNSTPWVDSSLFTTGGYCIDLNFFWYLHWPKEIRSKALKYFKKNMKIYGEH